MRPDSLLYLLSHTNLLWSQTLHVGRLEDVLEVFVQISDIGINRHLQQTKTFLYLLNSVTDLLKVNPLSFSYTGYQAERPSLPCFPIQTLPTSV